MNNRERALAILNYEAYDRMPVVYFGFGPFLRAKWLQEGRISQWEADHFADGNAVDVSLARRLGLDFNWYTTVGANADLCPAFETRVVEETPDGWRKVLNGHGVIILQRDGAQGIPPEVDHLLKGRAEWDAHFLPRLQPGPERIRVSAEQLAELRDPDRSRPVGLHAGSLYGTIRNWAGVVGLAYIQADDPALFDEMIDTLAELCYREVEAMLALPGVSYDFGHFWEDICYKNGPLINPRVFRSKVGPGYRRITELMQRHGINLVSLDCDGMIDSLLPIWLENGVNVMFPIEVGTWHASLEPWRQKYGRAILGVGGMDKRVLAYDYAAIDAEIERLRPLVALGGYLPCPDHRFPPDASWENIQYYCERMRQVNW